MTGARTGGSGECSLGAERPDLRESFAFDWHLGDDPAYHSGIFFREILDEQSVIMNWDNEHMDLFWDFIRMDFFITNITMDQDGFHWIVQLWDILGEGAGKCPN